jgi:L-tartrate/succinate antiporter
MSMTSVAASQPPASGVIIPPRGWWRAVVPVVLAAAIALLPPPPGLEQHAWYYVALFSGVIAALVTEPIPNPAVGLVGLTLAAVLSR